MRRMAMMVVTIMVSFGCATTTPSASSEVPTMAPASNTPAVAVAAPAGAGSGELRCEYRPVLGSRVGKKLCYSEEEWALMEKQADDVMKYIDEQTRRSPYSEGDP